MLGDDINGALEEQEKNEAIRRQQEKITNKKQKKNNQSSYSNETNNMIPGYSIQGDSIKPNPIEYNKKSFINYTKKSQPMNEPQERSKTKTQTKRIYKNINNNQSNSSFNTSNNNINENKSPTSKNITINKKKAIPLPKSNNAYKGKSPNKSPNRINKVNNNINNSPNFNNNRNNLNFNNDNYIRKTSNNTPDISKDEILRKIKECIKEVDPRYLNPLFNLMTEIINVFGDINFEKVKQDIERLKQCNTKLDDVIKLIVDKHSDEFFQILGYVRETKNIIESSKIKYDYAQVSLGNLTSNVSSLAINENMEWKLQSIFLNEIITRLSKTLHIFEILHECEEYIRNDKLFDAMNIINKTKEEHLNYDKEFRNYNLLVTINIRFIHIQKEINLKLITGLNQVIFFDDFKVKDEFYKEHKEKEVFMPIMQTLAYGNNETNITNNTTNITNTNNENESQNINNFNNIDNDILSKKIKSLINYYINYFSKISIDTEIVKPINKYLNIIEQVVNYKIEEELGLKFLSEIDMSVSANLNKVNYALNKRNTETLIYYIKCLREYNDESLLKLLNILIETINTSLMNFLCKTFEIITEKLKLIGPLLSKFNLEEKIDKIKFLLFLQISLTIVMHSLIKMSTLIKYTIKSNKNIVSINFGNLNEIKENKNTDKNNIMANSKQFKAITNKIYAAYEKCLIIILLTFHKNIIAKSELTEGDIGNINLASSHSFHDFVDLESLLKRKVIELTFLNFEHLSILYKIMDEIYFQCKDKYDIVFKDLKKYLTSGTATIYKFYSNKLAIQKFFDLASFTFEYDTSINNFKFLEDLTNKVETLKKLYIFALDVGYKELMKILRQLLIRYYEDQKNFLAKLKKDCIHRQLYNSCWDQLTKNKNNEDILKELLINYQFRKYTINSDNLDSTTKSKNNNISTTSSKGLNKENNFYDEFKTLTVNFIFDIIKSTKPSDQLVLLTRNYKLLEYLTKFMVCNGSICLMIESFIFDLMNKQFETAKIIALMEQLKTVKLENMVNDDNIDLSSLIIISISTLDNISQEKLKMLLLLKIEFCCLLIPLARNLTRNNYYLAEPQMTPEYFIISFINDFSMYYNLFQYSLEQEQYSFIMKDILLIINNIFIEAIKNMNNSINSYGANLIVRNFEYIKENLGGENSFYENEQDNQRFEKSIFYCVNYIKLLTVNDNKINEIVNKYFKIVPFDKSFVKPVLDLKRNSKRNINDMQIVKDNNDINSFL